MGAALQAFKRAVLRAPVGQVEAATAALACGSRRGAFRVALELLLPAMARLEVDKRKWSGFPLAALLLREGDRRKVRLRKGQGLEARLVLQAALGSLRGVLLFLPAVWWARQAALLLLRTVSWARLAALSFLPEVSWARLAALLFLRAALLARLAA